MINSNSFQKLDNRPIPEDVKEIRAFMCIRNEILRLPWALEYHRGIGVDRFIIIDNGSSDGSTEYLLSQDDVHCFYTTENYSNSYWGVNWINKILDLFGVGNWCLVIDADELFVYPFCEVNKINSFLNKLELSGFHAVFALVIDMYNKAPIKEAVYKAKEPFLDICQYFDVNTYNAFNVSEYPQVRICGGPRNRVFWSKIKSEFPSPTMNVVPLIKWQNGFKYLCGRHCMNLPLNFSFLAGTILHFKFFHDFFERVEKEVKRGEHFGSAREYNIYLQCIKDNPDLTLFYEDSMLYEGTKQLVELDLLKEIGRQF
jgi:glycosyltransferase involved in cell wall biosynthesis